MFNTIKIIKKIVYNLTAEVDTETGDLTNIPNSIIYMTIFMSLNAIAQAFADIIIEALVLFQLVDFKIPLRIEFIFLTLISTVIAYLTLQGMREGNLDVTKNTLIIGFLVESSLVVGDLYLLLNTYQNFWTIFMVRTPFIFLTSINIIIITGIVWRNLKLSMARPNYRF